MYDVVIERPDGSTKTYEKDIMTLDAARMKKRELIEKDDSEIADVRVVHSESGDFRA